MKINAQNVKNKRYKFSFWSFSPEINCLSCILVLLKFYHLINLFDLDFQIKESLASVGNFSDFVAFSKFSRGNRQCSDIHQFSGGLLLTTMPIFLKNAFFLVNSARLSRKNSFICKIMKSLC